jgi:iron complex outermembrane receptor protein
VDSGLDAAESDGWAILDMYGSYRFNKTASIDVGVNNVFDKDYAYHLNRSNAFDPTVVQINEPGRSIWAKLNIRW